MIDSQYLKIYGIPPINSNPNATDDTAVTSEDTSVQISVPANDSDPDSGDILTVSAVTQGTSGSVVSSNDGTVTYSPVADFFGSDSFMYTVDDGSGGTDTTTVTVNAVNDSPVVSTPSPM